MDKAAPAAPSRQDPSGSGHCPNPASVTRFRTFATVPLATPVELAICLWVNPRSNRSRMMSLQSIMFVFFIALAPLVWSWTAKVAPREKQWTDDFSHLPGTIRMIQNHPDAPPSDLHNNSQPREPADSDQTPKSCSSAQDSCSSVVGFLLKCARILHRSP